jgi:hypothetical protein
MMAAAPFVVGLKPEGQKVAGWADGEITAHFKGFAFMVRAFKGKQAGAVATLDHAEVQGADIGLVQ